MTEYKEELVDLPEEKRLLADVASIKDRADFHDVKFICKDGQVVCANKAFIASRSAYFDRMLFGDMMEANQTEIEFPAVSSAPLQLVFEYLHTCRVSSIEADTTAVEAYDLAEQYDLPGLQRLIVDYLVRYAKEHASIGPILSAALKLKASDVAETILPVVSTGLEEGRSGIFEGFSVDALKFCLTHPNLRSGWPNEMYVFKSVLDWAISKYCGRCIQMSPSESTGDPWEMAQDDIDHLRIFFKRRSEEDLRDWLSVLNGICFEKIPTEIIQQSIEPLDLIPTNILIRVYCNQAMRFSTIALKSSVWDATCRGTDVRIEQDLADFQSKNHQGIRAQTLFISGVHEWTITIERYCDLVWVGVVGDEVDMNDWLGKQKAGWMFGSNGTLCHDTQQDNGPYSHRYGASFREGAQLTVKLDMNKRELGFAVNGVDYDVAFTNLPGRVYPAISCRTPGAIRISLGSKIWSLVDNIQPNKLL